MNRFMIICILLSAIVAIDAHSQKLDNAIYYGNPKGTVYDLAFLNGGSALAVPEGNVINIYSINDQQITTKLEGGHTDVILSIDISSDNSFLISGGRDGLINLWDIKNDVLLTSLNYHQGVVTSVKFSPDNKLILSGATDNQVILYDITTNKVIFTMDGHIDDILSVDFSKDGLYGASSSADKTIKIWNLRNGNQLESFDNLNAWQRNIFFTNDSTKLISCGDDSYVSFWDVTNISSTRLLNKVKSGRKWLLSSDLHTDNNTIATGGMEGVIRIKFSHGAYSYKVGNSITKVLFIPNKTANLKVIAATLGGGVFMIEAKNMKLKN